MEFALSEILYFNFIVIFSYLVQQKGSIALLHRWILLLTLDISQAEHCISLCFLFCPGSIYA